MKPVSESLLRLKVALRSRRTRMERPKSATIRRWLVILSKAMMGAEARLGLFIPTECRVFREEGNGGNRVEVVELWVCTRFFLVSR